jgi:hypothetical protein
MAAVTAVWAASVVRMVVAVMSAATAFEGFIRATCVEVAGFFGEVAAEAAGGSVSHDQDIDRDISENKICRQHILINKIRRNISDIAGPGVRNSQNATAALPKSRHAW